MLQVLSRAFLPIPSVWACLIHGCFWWMRQQEAAGHSVSTQQPLWPSMQDSGAGVMNEQNTSVFSPGCSQSFTTASIRVCMCPSAFIFFRPWPFLPSGHSGSLPLCQWIGLLPLPRCTSELHPLLWGNRTPQAVANRTNLLGLTDYGTDLCLHQHTFSSSPLIWVNRKRHYSRAFGTDVEGMLLTGLLE